MLKLQPAALALCAAIASAASAAPGQPSPARPRVAVVDVEAPPTMMGLAAQVTREVLEAAAAQGYPVVSPDEVRAKVGEKEYAEAQKCHEKVLCLVTHLPGVQASRVVVGTLGRDEKSYLVHLWLIDLEKNDVVADVDRAILIASRRLTQDVTKAMPGLLRGEKEAVGTLKLSSNAPRVAVTVDGESHGLTPLTLELKPGKHTVHLEKKAYMPVDRLVTIEPRQVTDEQVRLIVIPGQTPEELEGPPPVVAAPREGQGPNVPAAAWVAAAGAIAAAGAGGYFGYTGFDVEKKLKAGFDPASGVYQGTRKDALAAKQDALIANLCFAASGVALATAVVLTVVGGPDDEAPKLQVAPAASPGAGGGLLFQGRF